MRKEKLPNWVIDRLFDDNKMASKRFGQLFKSVTMDSWAKAIRDLEPDKDSSYAEIDRLMISATEARNSFMHGENIVGMTNELAKNCHSSVPKLLKLFSSLHNKYVADSSPQT